MNTNGTMWRGVGVGLLVLAMGWGCQFRKEPEALPVMTAQAMVTHYAGDALSGPGVTVPAVDAGDAWSVRVRMVALEHMPVGALDSVGAHARLINAGRGDQSVLPTARLTVGARYGVVTGDELGRILSDPKVGRTAEIAQLRGALPVGVTASFSVSDSVWMDDPVARVPTRRTIRAELSRRAEAAGAVQAALQIEDLYRPAASPITVEAPVRGNNPRGGAMRRGPESRPATQPSAPVLQRELALLDPVAVGKTETMVFVVPFEFTGYPTAAVAIVLEVDHDSSAEQAATVAACEHDLAESAAKARVAPTTGPVAWTVPALSAAMNALTRPEARRSALIYMAGQTNANLLADTALVANEVTLAELATKVLAATTRPAVTTGPVDSLGELGWMLDHAAFGLLSDMATGGKLKNDPALAAVLVTHTGEAGRHPSSLKEIGNGVSSRADLQGRLIAENMIYLEDSSPGSRIRAYDFLKLRNREPAGYDPLGTPKERRDALERATQAAATTAPAGGQP